MRIFSKEFRLCSAYPKWRRIKGVYRILSADADPQQPPPSHPVDPSEVSVSVYGHSGDRCSKNSSRVRLHAESGGGGGAAGGNSPFFNRLHRYFTLVLFLMFSCILFLRQLPDISLPSPRWLQLPHRSGDARVTTSHTSQRTTLWRREHSFSVVDILRLKSCELIPTFCLH